MEMDECNGKDTEEDANIKSDIWSESREHEGFGNYKPDLGDTIPPEYQGDPNPIVDYLYNKL